MDFTKTLHADVIYFYTDDSGARNLGMGCVFGCRWMMGEWGIDFMDNCRPSIELLELMAVAAGILKWAPLLSARRVVIFCDNLTVCSMINDTTSSCEKCMKLIRAKTLICLHFNVRFFCQACQN